MKEWVEVSHHAIKKGVALESKCIKKLSSQTTETHNGYHTEYTYKS